MSSSKPILVPYNAFIETLVRTCDESYKVMSFEPRKADDLPEDLVFCGVADPAMRARVAEAIGRELKQADMPLLDETIVQRTEEEDAVFVFTAVSGISSVTFFMCELAEYVDDADTYDEESDCGDCRLEGSLSMEDDDSTSGQDDSQQEGEEMLGSFILLLGEQDDLPVLSQLVPSDEEAAIIYTATAPDYIPYCGTLKVIGWTAEARDKVLARWPDAQVASGVHTPFAVEPEDVIYVVSDDRIMEWHFGVEFSDGDEEDEGDSEPE